MKTLPDHRAADVDSLSDLGLFNLPRAAGRTLMSMAVDWPSTLIKMGTRKNYLQPTTTWITLHPYKSIL